MHPTAKAAATSSSTARNISRIISSVNSCKESFPTADQKKNSRQAGRIPVNYSSNISENVLL